MTVTIPGKVGPSPSGSLTIEGMWTELRLKTVANQEIKLPPPDASCNRHLPVNDRCWAADERNSRRILFLVKNRRDRQGRTPTRGKSAFKKAL